MKERKIKAIEEMRVLDWVFGSGYLKRFGTAIDGGAHVGNWSRKLAQRFEKVWAFEPVYYTFDKLCADLPSNVTARMEALYSSNCTVEMRSPPKRETSTAKYASPSKRGSVSAVAIDSLDWADGVDLIKLDLEGAEYLALQGAVRTIEKFWPVLIIESAGLEKQHGLEPAAAERFATMLGYRQVHYSYPNRVLIHD